MQSAFYVTTPIYYVNGDPHIGTAYTTLLADTLARIFRMRGAPVRFTTGTDEHAQKVYEQALAAGRTPMEHVDIYSQRFQSAWNELGLEMDDFIRTTETRHKDMVQSCIRQLIAKGYVYKGTYRGWYCKWDETFYPESKVDPERIKPGAARPLQFIEEENYFFRLSAFNSRLLEHFQNHRDFVSPATHRQEMIVMLEQGLEDISISRVGGKWGIPMPDDEQHVIYVWIEALMNYITSAGYLQDNQRFQTFWPATVQICGKDILKFHSLIWPAILMALELPLPKKILTHGLIMVDGQKMSKSLGNVQDPLDLARRFSRDALRYSLLRELSLGGDGNFDFRVLCRRYHAELANDLGNLVQRLQAIAEKNLQSRLIRGAEVDESLSASLQDCIHRSLEIIDRQSDPGAALFVLWEGVTALNRSIDSHKPWEAARRQDHTLLSAMLWQYFDAIRAMAHALSPYLPDTCSLLLKTLDSGRAPELSRSRCGLMEQELLLEKIPLLFPRLEHEIELTKAQPKSAAKPAEVTISIEDFNKIRLELVTIVESRPHPDAEKLLVLTVSTSSGKKQVVSGIYPHYRHEEVIGKQVVLVKNLEPREVRGVRSEGMLLAASNKKELSLVVSDRPVQEGSRVS